MKFELVRVIINTILELKRLEKMNKWKIENFGPKLARLRKINKGQNILKNRKIRKISPKN